MAAVKRPVEELESAAVREMQAFTNIGTSPQ